MDIHQNGGRDGIIFGNNGENQFKNIPRSSNACRDLWNFDGQWRPFHQLCSRFTPTNSKWVAVTCSGECLKGVKEQAYKAQQFKKDVMEDIKKKSPATCHNAYTFCEHCKVTGHVKEKCWKVHPELFPKKWVKDGRGKRTTTIAVENNMVKFDPVEGVDNSLMFDDETKRRVVE